MGQRRKHPAPNEESAEQARTDYVITWLVIGMAALFVVFMLADRHHVFDRPQNAVLEHRLPPVFVEDESRLNQAIRDQFQ